MYRCTYVMISKAKINLELSMGKINPWVLIKHTIDHLRLNQ